MQLKIIIIFFILCSFILCEQNSKEAMLKSLIIPGWGQFHNQQKIKGTIFFILSFFLGINSWTTYNDANKLFKEHEKYAKKGKEKEKDAVKYFEEYSDKYDTFQTLLGITCVVWLYNIVDANLNTKNKEIKKVKLDIYQKELTLNFSF